jgi:hypothetical protein
MLLVFITIGLVCYAYLWSILREDEIDKTFDVAYESREITTLLGAMLIVAMDLIFFPFLYFTKNTFLEKYAKMLSMIPTLPFLVILFLLNQLETKLKKNYNKGDI